MAEVRQESRHELELHFLAFLAAGAGRQVHRYHAETGKVRAQVTTLGIKLGDTQAGNNMLRPLAAIDAHAAVAFLFRIMEVAVIIEWREHLPGHVRFLRLEFLQANDVGILQREPFVEAFAGSGTDAVQIDGNDAHKILWGYPADIIMAQRSEEHTSEL